ncbi:MAG: hypothetical protein ABWZ27_00665 [Aestuariivirgaceae bacterium]
MSSTGQSPDQDPERTPQPEREAPPTIDLEASEVGDPPPAEEDARDGGLDETPPPSGAPRRRDATYVAAGLVAALIAGLGLGYWIYEMATSPNRDAMATLDDRVAALEKRLADNVTRSDEMMASLNGLRGEMQRLATQPPRGGEADGALAERLARTEQSMGEQRAALDELRKTLESQQAAPSAAPAETQAAVDQLKQRMGEIDAKLAQPPPPPPAPSVPPETAQKLDDTAQKANDTAQRVEDMDSRLKQAEAAVAAPKGPPPAPPAGAAFAALLTKVQSGEPYGPALDQMVGQLPDAPGIETLRAAADEGAPTMDELSTALGNITTSLNQPAPAPQEGLFAAMMNRIGSVVRVRRAGALDWPAASAKALEALKGGSLANAVAILGQGADPPDQIATWLKGARERLQVDEALASLSTAVLRHIAGSQS